MKSVLFICTGNIFRSMSAEYALKKYLENNGGANKIQVASAGIEAYPQPMAACVRERLLARAIDPSAHEQRRLTLDMLQQADLAVAMGEDHQHFIREEFDWEVPLFNEICYAKAEPVLDVWEAVPDLENIDAKIKYAVSVVDYICDAIPHFVNHMDRFMKTLVTKEDTHESR